MSQRVHADTEHRRGENLKRKTQQWHYLSPHNPASLPACTVPPTSPAFADKLPRRLWHNCNNREPALACCQEPVHCQEELRWYFNLHLTVCLLEGREVLLPVPMSYLLFRLVISWGREGGKKKGRKRFLLERGPTWTVLDGVSQDGHPEHRVDTDLSAVLPCSRSH